MKRIVPVLVACTLMGHESAIEFLVNYERLRPAGFPVELIPQRADTWNEEHIAAELWTLIKSRVEAHAFFGVAIDGGIDTVLSRFVLITVLYVGEDSFEFPPLYQERGKSFDGKTTATTLYRAIQAFMGSDAAGVPFVARLRYMIVDGCGVNHCARDEMEELIMELGPLEPLGEDDWKALIAQFVALEPFITLLPCVGHLISNIAKTAMERFLVTRLFDVRKNFRNLFYASSGKSGKKGRFGGVALDHLLSLWDGETEAAITSFTEMHSAVQAPVSSKNKEAMFASLSSNLRSMAPVVPLYSTQLAFEIEGSETRSLEHRCARLLEMAPRILEEIAKARKVKAVTAPKLGGVTRWADDKFTSIEFLRDQLSTIARFVATELARLKSSTAPASLVNLAKLLTADGLDPIRMEAEEFLLALRPIREALNKFSDYKKTPMASSVSAAIDDLQDYAEAQTRAGDPSVKAAVSHHLTRINKRHELNAFDLIKWFHLNIVKSMRMVPGVKIPTATEMSALFNNAVVIDKSEWDQYVTCREFMWDESIKHEVHWWKVKGKRMFPALFVPAVCFLSVPAVVTQCDSLLSVMGAKFNRRQSRLGPMVAANMIFLRANKKHTAAFAELDDPSTEDSSEEGH